MEPAGPPRPQVSAPPVQRPTTLAQGQAAAVPPVKKSNAVWVALLILILFTIIGLAVYVYIYLNPNVGNQIVIQNQPVEGKIHVDKLVVKTPSFLVIQLMDAKTREPTISNVYAETPYLTPDIYLDFDWSLFEAIPDRLLPGTVLFATLYKDSNGNLKFEWPTDDPHGDTEPVTDLLGNPIRIQFQAK